jgi:hypothetical protein
MATTGTKTGSGDFSGLNDAMKNVYDVAVENNIEQESEVLDIFESAAGFETKEGPDGKGIYLEHTFSSGGGVSAMNEDDYFPTSQVPTIVQSSIKIPQIAVAANMSGRTMRRVKAGPAAFATWADEQLPRKAQRAAFQIDRMLVGTGTGIIGRISGTPDGTGDIIASAYGISGLEGAGNLILRGDSLRYSSNASGAGLRAGAAVVTSKPTAAGVFNTDAVPTSAADGDYVALGDANVNSFGTKEIMGLEGILDDGTNVATFQGLSRSTYPEMNAQIIDAASSTYGATLSEELIDFADSQAYEQGDGGKPNILLCNRSGNRSFWKSLKADRLINDPRGTYTGGRAKLTMIVGDREVSIRVARKVPSSRAYGIDTSSIKKYEVGTAGWVNTTGAVFQRVSDATGYKDAYVAFWIKEMQLGATDPARNYKIVNLAAA